MLSNENVRKINRQIESELRTVNSITSSDEKKVAALDRIARLKELLNDEKPSRQSILKDLATALIEAREETIERNRPTDIFDAIFGIRR